MKNIGAITTIERDKHRPKVAPWMGYAVRTFDGSLADSLLSVQVDM